MKSPFKLLQLLLAALLLSFALAACGPADEAAGDEIPITSIDDPANIILPTCGGAYYCTGGLTTGSNVYFSSVLAPGTPTRTQALASCNAAVARGSCRGPCQWTIAPYCTRTCTCPK